MTYDEIVIPSWCGEYMPAHPLGCWGLIGGMVEDHTYCIECDSFKPIVINEKEVVLNSKLIQEAPKTTSHYLRNNKT